MCVACAARRGKRPAAATTTATRPRDRRKMTTRAVTATTSTTSTNRNHCTIAPYCRREARGVTCSPPLLYGGYMEWGGASHLSTFLVYYWVLGLGDTKGVEDYDSLKARIFSDGVFF